MADEAYISFEQAAERLGIDEDALLDLVAANELQAVRVNRETKFKEADIEAYASREVDTNVSLDSVDLEDLPDDIVLLEGKTPAGGFSEPTGETPSEPLQDDTGELLDADDAGVLLLPDESDILEPALQEEPAPEPAASEGVIPAPLPEPPSMPEPQSVGSDTDDFLDDLDGDDAGADLLTDESDSIFNVGAEEDVLDAGVISDAEMDGVADEMLEVETDVPMPSSDGDDEDGFLDAGGEADDDDFLDDEAGVTEEPETEAEGEEDALSGADAEINADVEPEELKESGGVGEIDLDEAAQGSGDAEAEIPMTDHDEFDDETEPLMDAPDDSDGLGTEEILFDDEDLEIGDDGFGIGTEEATIQEDILVDDEDGEEKTLLVDDDDDEATIIAEEVDEEEDEDGDESGGGSRGSARRSSARASSRSSGSSIRRRPTMSAGKSSEQASNLVWAGLMMMLVVSMSYPLFLYGLIIWKGETDSAESFAPIDFSNRASLKNVGPIVVHDWFKWFPEWEPGDDNVRPREWWGYPPRFSEEVAHPSDPTDYVPTERRVGQQAVRTPVGGPTVPDAFQEDPVDDGASTPDPGDGAGDGGGDAFDEWG